MTTPPSRVSMKASGHSTGKMADRLRGDFLAQYGQPVSHCVAAPGRVNFIGEHLDYNDGFVMPLAIDRFVVIAGTSDPQFENIEIYSEQLQESLTIEVGEKPQPITAGWQNYVLGVIAGLQERGFAIPPLRAIVSSTVPLGSGLSSSAALEVAVATFLESITCQTLDLWDKTLLCQQAEHRFAGMPCGIMDQFSSVFGKSGSLMLLDCRSRAIQYIPFSDPQYTLLVANSNVKHELVDGEYALRRQQCESASAALGGRSLRDVEMASLSDGTYAMPDVVFRRARHVVSEIQRTVKCATAIQDREWKSVGELMYQSHDSLRDDYQVSCGELDLLVDICRELGLDNGVLGSRMTGGGFGGSTVTLLKTANANRVMDVLAEQYALRTGIEPSLFCCRPAAGARVL